jgi:hypothetical protein
VDSSLDRADIELKAGLDGERRFVQTDHSRGDVIRATNGGAWVVVASGTLPFALKTRFQGGDATVNPLGKAMKRFAGGDEDSVAALVRFVQSQP